MFIDCAVLADVCEYFAMSVVPMFKVPIDLGLIASHIMPGPISADFSTLYMNKKGVGQSSYKEECYMYSGKGGGLRVSTRHEYSSIR